jgi:hypothetical protein
VDNRTDTHDLAPDPDNLVRLLEATHRYGRTADVTFAARTVADQHRITHGHFLAYGCCSDRDDMAA